MFQIDVEWKKNIASTGKLTVYSKLISFEILASDLLHENICQRNV